MVRYFAIVCGCLLQLLLGSGSYADTLTVRVQDKSGQPFTGAVVEIRGGVANTIAVNSPSSGVMDQIDRQFVPHILVVDQGALVDFPNSDSIKHHVYSFSEAKRFQLKLYKGKQPEPLLFDRPGVVALGCNIHDWMVGYIYVAESKTFARSDSEGVVSFELPPGQYQVVVWHPRFREKDVRRVQDVLLDNKAHMSFKLKQSLYPLQNHQVDEFEDY